MTTSTATSRANELAAWLRILVAPGAIVELRVLGCAENNGYTREWYGYFDTTHLDALAGLALDLTRRAEGVYWTLNPVDPALHARACNRIKGAKKGEATGDQHIRLRRWLLIDCDPVRPSGISSSDAEKGLAYKAILAVRDYLRYDAGWPAPILADSGNGYHLLYRIDLPADDGGLTKRCLQALAARFDNAHVKIDQSVFNPSRICKLYGTQARKGDSTEDRPHRRAAVLEIPGCDSPGQPEDAQVEVVSEALLQELAPEVAAEPGRSDPGRNGTHTPPRLNPGSQSRLDVSRWLTDRGVSYTRDTMPDGRDRWRLDHCPFNPEHTDKDVAVFQSPDGALGFKCFHNSCQGNHWQEARDQIGRPGPEYYDNPPASNGAAHSSRKTPPQQTTSTDGPPREAKGRRRDPIEIYTADTLMKMELPEPAWAVPGLLPEGLVVLGGKPKLGKSWLALNFAIAVASGGCTLGIRNIEPGHVLYLALEDGYRRLQDRLRKLMGSQPGVIPGELHLARRWPRQDKEGLALLGEWLEGHRQARLVVIDTWTLFRALRRGGRGGSEIYEEDYGAAVEIKGLADTYHCCIMLVSHCRKGAADDWQDSLLGSQGLAGAADCTMVLQRTRGEHRAALHTTGRDAEERTLNLQWIGKHCLWDVAEAPAVPSAPTVSPTVQKAMDWLRTHLADGQNHRVCLVRRASEDAEIGTRQLYEARDRLGVVEEGPVRGKVWRLPPIPK